MAADKIFPSDALKIMLLQRIRKVTVQQYLVDKFKEVREKIEHKSKKIENKISTNNKETK